ncbi:MAG: 50S ribosomal protein L10 [Arenicella sp.]|jgi:large subunit ribosomal protein L10|nr:50S ribosomal protein L10 [Arenicella sp.]HAU68952.1 50S ribosomal protein L10 [Gammaproteobacteria bacterium]
MSLNLSQKKQVVEDVSAVVSNSTAAVIAEYRGMTVEQMKVLRRDAHDNNVFVRVVKNTLLRRAVKGTDFECLDELLIGPLAFAASEDPVAVAKILDKYAKQFDALNIKAGSMAGSLLNEAEIKALAQLPSREELLAKLLGTMQAPIAKFVQTLNEVPTKFVRGLAAVRDAKEA